MLILSLKIQIYGFSGVPELGGKKFTFIIYNGYELTKTECILNVVWLEEEYFLRAFQSKHFI